MKVIMKKNTLIDASAINEGDGGTVVLWSDILNAKSTTFVLGDCKRRHKVQRWR